MTRFVEKADEAGVMHRYEIDDDGNVTIEALQDTSAHIARNKRDYNSFGREQRKSEMWRVASIPDIIIVKWLNEDGINVFKKEDRERVRKKLNDPDYRYLRTAPGTI